MDGVDAPRDRRAEYAEWVERMKAKRAENVDRVRRLQEDPEPAEEPAASYWSASNVYDESRRLEGAQAAVVAARTELLAVLGLNSTATDEDVVSAYRRQAKEHHPDRFHEADPELRAAQVERMQRISAAYRALQETSPVRTSGRN